LAWQFAGKKGLYETKIGERWNYGAMETIFDYPGVFARAPGNRAGERHIWLPQPTQAGLLVGDDDPVPLIGPDDDNLDNPLIQPADTDVNQSLNNTDILQGGPENNVIIGLLGNDVLLSGPKSDITIGGTEQGQGPNSDVILGGEWDDVNIWAPGDGSDAYVGGSGLDAQVFGVIDRDEDNVPTLDGTASGFPYGSPTADVTGQGGFCTLERVDNAQLAGYEFLVRFFVRATGDLAVIIRLAEVEQVFCTSEAGGAIIYADLTADNPEFVEVELEEVEGLNGIVADIIR
jgi:hypothetical protein